ncbi:MAG: hypothetical protein IPP66_03765 [Anaerolineales bacterium]|nr:hypothetical protein [Anaerolineales bacterium]
MQNKRLFTFLLLASTNIGLVVLAYIGNFTRMLADDLCSIYYANRFGLFRSMWYWYISWSGRYTAFAVDWLILDRTLGPYNMHYIIPGTVLICVILCASILYLHLKKNNKQSFAIVWAFASIFVYLIFLLAPDIRQGFFWFNGMRSYTLPLVVIIFYTLLFQIIVVDIKAHVAISSILGFILLFISGGLSETFAIAQLVFLLFIIFLHILKIPSRPKTDLIILSASLAGALLSLIVIVMAPGNAIRQGNNPNPNLMELTIISLQSYVEYLGIFFVKPEKVLGLIGGVLAFLWYGNQHKELAPAKIHIIPAYILGGFTVSLACFPPGVYGYFDSPPPRTMTIPTFFLITSLLCASFLLGAWLSAKREIPWLESKFLLIAISATLVTSSFLFSWKLFNERGIFIEFAERWDKTDALILDARARHMDSVNVPNMNNWTNLGSPTDNPKYWQTECYSQYYDIQVIGPPFQ